MEPSVVYGYILMCRSLGYYNTVLRAKGSEVCVNNVATEPRMSE